MLPSPVVSSRGGRAGREALRTCRTGVGVGDTLYHLPPGLCVAGPGIISLSHDWAVGPPPDSLRPWVSLRRPCAIPAPEPERGARALCLQNPPLVLPGGQEGLGLGMIQTLLLGLELV